MIAALKILYKVFFSHLLETERTEAYAPKELFAEICSWNQCSHYKLGRQQDSAELLSVLLQKLTEQNKTAGNLYTGELETTTCCRVCHTVTARDEPFSMLTINIEQNPSNLRVSSKQNTAPKLEELLRISAREEELGVNNKYDCRNFGKLQMQLVRCR